MRIPIQKFETIFNIIQKESLNSGPVIILSAFDCDGLCACRIIKVFIYIYIHNH